MVSTLLVNIAKAKCVDFQIKIAKYLMGEIVDINNIVTLRFVCSPI